MINFFKNFQRYIDFKKNEKKFKRVIFNENSNTFRYIKNLSYLNKQCICIISIEDIKLKNEKNLRYYYFNNNFFLSIFFLFLKVKYLYCTTPDLNFNIFRKSIYNLTKYIYIQHSPVSLSMAYKKKAFYNFDCLQVVNKNQYSELLEINKKTEKKIKPIKSIYILFNYSLNNNYDKKENLDL